MRGCEEFKTFGMDELWGMFNRNAVIFKTVL